MDMKKRSFKKLITLSLTLAMLTGVAGCGKQQSLNAETNPDTPVSDVQFPLKEKAELSFITSAPATSTQDPNERTIFKRMEEQTNVHIDWTCFVSDQFSDKKNLALAQFGNLPDGLFNAGMSDYDLLRYAKQGIIIPVENLIDKYMPNLKAVFEKYPEYRTMCTAPDGHIYSFPWIEQLGSGKEAIQAIGDIPYINKKWLVEPNVSYHGVSFAKDCAPAAFATYIRAILLRDTGATISPVHSFIFLQGLETLSLRVERHVENALKVVQYLKDQPLVEKVNHPSISEDKEQQELYKKYFPNGGGSIFTFEIKGGAKEAQKFIDNLELFSLLANVADVKSLAIHPASTTHSECNEAELLDQGIKPNTIRLSIGTENVDDIIEDLDEAFKALAE